MRRRERRPAPEPACITGAFFMIAGVRYELTAVYLSGGEIRFDAVGHGPTEPGTGYAALFGSDGQGICQFSEGLEVPRTVAGQVIYCTLHGRVTHA